ncbi:MAG: type VI secretion system-associated FHA domain protein TagH [Rhodobacteraceae bacterium]|nr:type VI secretion system-associated FHA domain protein TagH [Paracoccaceae bacterium]
MSLRIVIENSPHPQPVREMRHAGGDLTIGRAPDCDWQIDDPDMYISRRHAVISGRDGQWTVTDASRGGLFVDGATTPLGAGNSARLEHGTRLRMGDVVLRVEFEEEAPARAGAPPAQARAAQDDFFTRPVAAEPRVERPKSLPEPFDAPRPSMAPEPARRAAAPPPQFDDPFTLDPVRPGASPALPPGPPGPAPAPAVEDFRFDDFFGPRPQPERPAPRVAVEADFSFGPAPVAPAPAGPAVSPEAPPAVPPGPAGPAAPAAAAAQPLPAPQPPPQPQQPPQPDLRDAAAAFLRGAGLPAAALSEEELEALGRRFRLLVEGLVVLLRTRAKEKGSARVAQTVIGSADVNPLKFLATTEEAVAALVAPRGPGYLAPDAAIDAAFRDLSDHHVRTWAALQAALRRMIDRFDPEGFEKEAEEAGALRSLIPGSRGARLWQYYVERYREIAKAAEDRFLGDVGADFRDAYEGRRREERTK